MVDPLLTVNWVGEILRVRTVTGEAAPEPEAKKGEAKEGEAKEVGKKEGEAKEAAESRPRLRGLDLPKQNEKPVLVYFHWPHEDGDRGKRIVKFCSGPLDDEAFVRSAPLFHCVEVNTRDSEEKLVAEAKVTVTPTLLVCAPDGTVVWRNEDGRLSGKALATALRGVLAKEFPGRWTAIETEAKEQAEGIRKAKELAARKKTEEAADALRLIVSSDVRFTEAWAEARRMLAE